MIVGVDFDTYQATLVGLPLEGWGQPTRSQVVFRKKSQTGDDACIAALKTAGTHLLLDPQLAKGGVFFIERGFGASRRADYFMGAFFGIILSACHRKGGHANVMHASEWKKAISGRCGLLTAKGDLGNGTLKKPEAHRYVREVADSYGHDITTYDADALDAYAMAVTGRWLNDSALNPANRLRAAQ